MDKIKIKFEQVNDDWERLYINGKLICENHNINCADLCQALEELQIADVTETIRVFECIYCHKNLKSNKTIEGEYICGDCHD